MTKADQESRFLGHVAWDGSLATSERALLRTSVAHRHLVERNQYVRILDEEGRRSGFLARILTGPFFHRAGAPTVAGLGGASSQESFLLADLEIQGEIVDGRSRDTNSRPAPGSSVYVLSPTEVSELHGFKGDMVLGNLCGQDDQYVCLQSKNKGVLPRNLGIFGTVGSGKSNTSQVLVEEAARHGWAVIVLDVESEYTDMDLPSDEAGTAERLARFQRRPEGLRDFHVYCPASCTTDKAGSHPFTLRLADFDTSVIGEILQVSLAERNALLDCVEYLQQKSRTKLATGEAEIFQMLLDASPQAKLPFTLRTLRERANDRSSRCTEFFDFSGLTAKLSWLLHAEAFDVVNMPSLDPVHMMVPGRVSILDVSLANDVVKNMVTADLLRKAFALKISRPSTPPTLIIIEEAHSFISRERAQTMQATLHMLRSITRRGRKRWLSMAFVSQQPGHLPPEIFELCNTRIVHTLRSMHNLDALMATTGDVSRELWARCPLLGQGQAVLSSPQLNRSVIMSVRPAACRRKFTHSQKTKWKKGLGSRRRLCPRPREPEWMPEPEPDVGAESAMAPPRRASWPRWTLAALLLLAVVAFYALGLHRALAWEQVRTHLDAWQTQAQEQRGLALGLFFLLYVAVTALSLPVAGVLSLVGGALFGRWLGTAILSLASTTGGTLAFLSSRYLLRDWVQRRFGARLTVLNEGVKRDGVYYLFTLRLVPFFPFFLVNLGMGLTPMKTWTFVWASWLGMLPGTFLYAHTGAVLGSIASPAEVLSPGVLLSLGLLGVAPLALRWLVGGRGRA